MTRIRSKKETKMCQKLVNELVTVTNKSGINISKRKSLYEYAFKKKYFYYR